MVEHVKETPIGYELEDEHGHVRLQAAPNEADQVGVPHLEMEEYLMNKVTPYLCFLAIFYDGAFNCDPLVVFGVSLKDITKTAFSDGFLVRISDLRQFFFRVDSDARCQQ